MGGPPEDGRAEQIEPMAQSIGKYSVAIDGHRTSVSLEPEFWRALKEIAAARSVTLAALVAEIDRKRQGNLSSALRVFVLKELSGK